MLLYEPQSDTVLQLADKPFASGGEGKLYRIEAPADWRQYVAKVYHPSKRSQARADKLRYLLAHPPQTTDEGHQSLIWPSALLYESGQMMGFLMPLAKGEKLEVLCTPKLPRKLDQSWARLQQGQVKALQLRLKLCFNIAVAVHHIHETGRYALVDLKPDNIMVQPNGLIAIVDSDSIEVIEAGKAVYPGRVATPEYSPPESYRGLRPGEDTILPSWDRFSLAVIFYRLLLGIHPFAATFTGPYEQATGLAQKIEAGLFVHSSKAQRHLRVAPPLHQRFKSLPDPVQDLFQYCFEEGHENPNLRPTAEEWCSALSNRKRIRVQRPSFSEQLSENSLPALPEASDFRFKPSPILQLPQLQQDAPVAPVRFSYLPKQEKVRSIAITLLAAFFGLKLFGLPLVVQIFVMIFLWSSWLGMAQYLGYYTHFKYWRKRILAWQLSRVKWRERLMRWRLLLFRRRRARLNRRMEKIWRKQLKPEALSPVAELQALQQQRSAFLKEQDALISKLCQEEEQALRSYRQAKLDAFKHLKGMTLEHKIKRLEKQSPGSTWQTQELMDLKAAQQDLEQEKARLKALYDARYTALLEEARARWTALENNLSAEAQLQQAELEEKQSIFRELQERYTARATKLRQRYAQPLKKAAAQQEKRHRLEQKLKRYEEITIKNYQKLFKQ